MGRRGGRRTGRGGSEVRALTPAAPAVTVIVPNFNGARHLAVCLPSLHRQTHPDFATLVVDDASTDASRELVGHEFPGVQMIELPRNRGFVAAVNAGIRATASPIVALLNNDTEPEPRWLEELCRPLATDPTVGFCASKLLLFDRREVIHSAGDFYGFDGVPGNRGVWQTDRGQYDREEDVFGACGGAAAYRRAMLEQIGLFDEDLWMYCEDVDLSWRAQLAGWRCRFVPTARVYHRLSATGGGPIASFYCGRNFIHVLARNVPGPLLRRYRGRIVAAQLRFALESLRHAREPAARARLWGQLAGLRMLPRALGKRRAAPPTDPANLQRLEKLLSNREA
ncbi:MAG: glycosyltransferase family 2 protein [Chloroflexi bacterium]|nr:glycosyltransferase family 2 protein [Chloroflexota bacterium]